MRLHIYILFLPQSQGIIDPKNNFTRRAKILFYRTLNNQLARFLFLTFTCMAELEH